MATRKPARSASGDIDIVVGTHALFQETVTYHDLVFAVVDEQHRFGVHQRLAITAKGDAPDMLVMTATPIPRTLVLTAFGDMDVSKLTEKPVGRQPIRTVTLPLSGWTNWSDACSTPLPTARKSTGSARWSRNPKRSS
jgi:RecG-like helicase